MEGLLDGLGHLVGTGFIILVVTMAIRHSSKEISREREVARAAREQIAAATRPVAPSSTRGLHWEIAWTTGQLASRGHKSAPKKGNVPLDMLAPDLAQGTGLIGPPGTGKTWTVVEPFVAATAGDPTLGMFVPSVKEDFAELVEGIVRRKRHDAVVYRVGPSRGGLLRWNLMSQLAPDAVAGFIRTVGERKGGGGDATWTDAATSHAQSCALLLHALTDGGTTVFEVEVPVNDGTDSVKRTYGYNFIGLHALANTQKKEWDAVRAEALAHAAVIRARGDADVAEQIDIALEARRLEFDELADKTRSSVLMNINSVLGPLTKNLELRRAFASETDFDINDLSKGAVIIVDIDIDRFRGSAEFLFMLAFEQFSGFALRRMKHAPNSVAFVGDEFQQYASERSVDFFSLSRQAKIVNLITIQTMSRLIGKVRSKENAHAILSTLGSLLCFPTSDPETIQFVTQIVGAADVNITSVSVAEGESTQGGGSSSTTLAGGSTSWGEGSTTTTTTSTALQQRAVVDAHLMRGLKSYFPPEGSGQRGWAQAVGFLRVGGKIVDDVVTTYSAPA